MKKRIVAVIVALLVGVVSTILHMPALVSSALFGRPLVATPLYDDFYQSIYNGLYVSSCSGGENWVNSLAMRDVCQGRPVFPIPYVDYRLNQPPSYLLLASSLIYVLNKAGYKPVDPRGGVLFYVLESIIQIVFLAVSSLFYDKLLERLGSNFARRAMAFLFPSFLAYSVYSMDTITLFFLVLSLYLLESGRVSIAVLALSIGSSFNIILLAPLGFILYQDLIGRVSVKTYYVLIGLIPYILSAAVSPGSILNYFMNLIDNSQNNGLSVIVTYFAGRAGYGFWVGFYLVVLYILLRLSEGSCGEGLLHCFMLFTVFSIILNPSLPPQSILLVLPLLYILVSDQVLLIQLYAADFFNSIIMALWFNDSLLRYYLNVYAGINVPVYDNPWTLESPVQWVVQARNIILLALSLKLLG
ncbi:hypothetical protein ACSU1N_03500 [Thermogladius sp. 4427co]|uniref:hypothetical protein n=1 Tax=Thermogladius sp. 4427co TaxID=3450718 RepID=UPI003F7B2488